MGLGDRIVRVKNAPATLPRPGAGHRKVSPMPPKTLASSPLDKATAAEVVWDQVSDLFNLARGIGDVCFVYVIAEADDGPVKIGVAKDPISRLRAMQTGNPRRLRLEYVLLGDKTLERRLHEYWEPWAIRSSRNSKKADTAPGTEWFKPEVREKLFPIMETAADTQWDFVFSVDGEITLDHLDRSFARPTTSTDSWFSVGMTCDY